jgi:hypothetical protein
MPLMHRWLWILPAALSLTSTGAAAVDPKQILSTVTGQSPTADAPLAARDIPARADVDEQFAEDVLQRVAGPDATEALGPQIEALAAGVTTLGRRMRKVDLTRMPVIRLESLQRNWRFYGRQLEAWQREAQRQLDRDSADAAQLAQRRVTWAATRKQAQSRCDIACAAGTGETRSWHGSRRLTARSRAIGAAARVQSPRQRGGRLDSRPGCGPSTPHRRALISASRCGTARHCGSPGVTPDFPRTPFSAAASAIELETRLFCGVTRREPRPSAGACSLRRGCCSRRSCGCGSDPVGSSRRTRICATRRRR